MNTKHPLDQLHTTNRALHRAQRESFAFRLQQGAVIVRNQTHETPADHEYRVTVRDGVPVACTCPAEAQYAPACKHRIAVAIRDAVRETAMRMQQAAAGDPVDTELSCGQHDAEPEPVDPPADCRCTARPDDVPCWPCVRAGRTTTAARDGDRSRGCWPHDG